MAMRPLNGADGAEHARGADRGGPATRGDRAAAWLLALTPLFWAGNFLAGKYVVGHWSPVVITAARWTVAAAVLVPYCRWREGGWPRPRRGPMPWGTLWLLGATGIFGFNILLYRALQSTTTISGSLLHAATPVVTAGLAAVILKEGIRARLVAGIGLSVTGVAVILTGGSLAALASLTFNPGDLVMLLAVLAWAVYSVLGRQVMDRLSPLAATTYAVLAGLVLLWPAALWELARGRWPAWSLPGAAAIGYMGLFASVVAFVWWYRGVRQLGAARASVFTNLLPVYTSALAVAVAGESLTLAHVVGGLLVAAGVTLPATGRARRAQLSPARPLPSPESGTGRTAGG